MSNPPTFATDARAFRQVERIFFLRKDKGPPLYCKAMVVAVAHIAIAAIWLGSMTYSLLVVQPAVARFPADQTGREELLVTLAHGNRWPVVGLVAALALSAIAAMIAWPEVAAGFAVALALYAAAAGIFVNVSWRHWPARVFALPEELAGYRRRLRIQAWTMTVLVGAAFLVTLSVSVAA